MSWAHPKFGSLLASCGFDGRVIIWQEGYNQKWQAIYTSDDKLHTASVNSVAWAPEEVGLVLASASSDGSIGFLAYNNGKWESTKIASAHEMGALSVTWANPYPAGALFLGLWNSNLPSYIDRLFICLCSPGRKPGGQEPTAPISDCDGCDRRLRQHHQALAIGRNVVYLGPGIYFGMPHELGTMRRLGTKPRPPSGQHRELRPGRPGVGLE